MKKNKALFLIIVAVFWFCQYVFVPYQTPFLLAMGIAASFLGVVVGAYGFTQMLMRLPVGLFADINGRHKPFIITGISCALLSCAIRVILPNDIGFLTGNLLAGIASSTWISFIILFQSYFNKEKNERSTGLIVSFNNLGILIAFMFGTFFYDSFGMEFLCIAGSVAAVVGIILSLFIKESEKNLSPLPVRELTKIYLDKKLIAYSLLALVSQGVATATAMSFSLGVARQIGATGTQIGIMSIIYICFGVITSYLAGTKLSKSLGRKKISAIVFALLAIYCILIPNLTQVYMFYFVQPLMGFASGLLFSVLTSAATKHIPPEKKSTAMGFYQAVYALGMTAFPVIAGAVSDIFSTPYAFYTLAILCAAALVSSLLIFTRKAH